MTKLEQLIEELCPMGVDYKPLGDICNIVKGSQLNKESLKSDGKYPVINGGINPSGFWDEFNFKSNTITISQGGASAGYVNYMSTPFWAGAHCYVVDSCDKTIIYEYLYHFLKMQQINFMKNQYGAGIPSLSLKTINAVLIPIPPLSIQEEIVGLLNSFSNNLGLLKSTLSDEVAYRKQQLEYYREKSFAELPKWVRLNEICNIYLGLTATPNYVDSGVKFISAQNTSSDYLDLENTKFISEEDYQKATSNAKPQRGDVLFTRVGSNLGHPVIVETDEKLCIFVSLGFLRVKDKNVVVNKWLKHWMNTDLFWDQVKKNVHGAAKVNLNTGWLKDFEIPLPSLEEQILICENLDRMQSNCLELSSNLLKEIGERQKQYEYYRDKLLTFKEKVN